MEQILQCKFTSATVKARLQDPIEQFPALEAIRALRGERVYLSLLATPQEPLKRRQKCALRVQAPFPVRTFDVEQVPVRLPHYPDAFDENYLSHEPGLYPDILRPADEVLLCGGRLTQLLLEIEVPTDAQATSQALTVELVKAGEVVATASIPLQVLDAVLPRQTLTFAQWMHYDCIATHYGVEVFSARHWELIQNFITGAVHSGVTALLTPVFTPPLDTEIGGERPTVQLVGVERKEGIYTFDFSKLERFCAMAKACGIKELEIAHLFTQWGAYHAPKVMGTENGEYRRLFGWETDATDPEYIAFLHALIPQVRQKLAEYGFEGHYFFHISDEPRDIHLDSYRAARKAVLDLLEGAPVRDALSYIEFYQNGLVTAPIPSLNHADEFVAAGVPDLWVYYCCSQGKDVSNRFIAMPGHRTRVLGAQMFRAGVTGFLHWGYNFYYTALSAKQIDPFLITDGDYSYPAGDAFSVYPAPDGTPWHSLREVHFYMGLTDMRLLTLAAERLGRERVLAELDAVGITDFMHYPASPDALDTLRENILDLL